MNKAFTLLELVVVIIILGVLATLGFTQYASMVEKGRQAEAKQILGDMRKLAIGYRLQNGTIDGVTNADCNIGTAQDQIPGVCRGSHYFYYLVEGVLYGYYDPQLVVCCTRCTSGGKNPQALREYYICLITNLMTGAELWNSNF